MNRLRQLIVTLISSTMVFSSVGMCFAEVEGNTAEPLTVEETQTAEIHDISIREAASTEYNVVAIEWDAVEGAIKYHVELSSNGEIIKSLDTESNSAEITELAAGELYLAKVTAYDAEENLLNEGTIETYAKNPIDTYLPPVGNVRYLRGYNTVKMIWSKVDGATGYKVYMRLIQGKSTDTVMPSKPTATTKSTSYVKALSPEKKYNVWIVAYKTEASRTITSEPYLLKKVQKAHPLYYDVKLKKTMKVKCSCSGHKSKAPKTFYAGETYSAYWFSKGIYRVKSGSHMYFIPAIKCKAAQCSPEAKNPLTKEEIEYFVKEAKPKRKTKKLLVAMLFTQRVYVMKRDSKGVYRMEKDFICGSGKAETPSPRGMNMKIWKRIKYRNGRPRWSCYNQINAFHGLKGKEYLRGRTVSHGCIRVNNVDRDYIWNNVPLNSSVIVY